MTETNQEDCLQREMEREREVGINFGSTTVASQSTSDYPFFCHLIPTSLINAQSPQNRLKFEDDEGNRCQKG